MDVVILAGGLGTRIKSVLGDTPKVLAPVGERIFLDILLARLRQYGASHIHLCLGHLADKVIDHLQSLNPVPIDVDWVVESQPLGTAGALRLVADQLTSDPVLVLNGDTWFNADLKSFVDTYNKSGVMASILSARVDDGSQYGRLEVDAAGHVQKFIEKDGNHNGPALISAGIYLFSAAMMNLIYEGEGASLEMDFLQMLPPGVVMGHIGDGNFIDIGTPKQLAQAVKFID